MLGRQLPGLAGPSLRGWDLGFTILFLAGAGVFFLLLLSSLYALGRTGVPVRHSPPEAIAAACRLAAIRDGDQILDVGAGNGGFLLHVARNHAVTAVGWELSLPMLIAARSRMLLAGMARRVRVGWGDSRAQDWSGADVVYCYLMPRVLEGVREKLLREAKPGARVLSFAFPVPGWTPAEIAIAGSRKDPVYLYRMDEIRRSRS